MKQPRNYVLIVLQLLNVPREVRFGMVMTCGQVADLCEQPAQIELTDNSVQSEGAAL